MSGKHWLGTYFLDEIDEDRFLGLFKREGVTAAVGQHERCPDTGKLHLQFYIELSSRRRMGYLKKSFPSGIHWEKRKGTVNDAVDYCSKEESRVAGPWTFGSFTNQGKRSDLEALKSDLDRGCSLKTISELHFQPFLRYRNSISAYILMHQTPRDWPMENYVFWGESGTGKTRMVYDKAKENNETVYPLSQNANGTVWFDGYAGEDIVLIDDFYGWIKISYMLKLMDRYPMMVQVKGSTLPFISKKIIITSNKHPDEWYNWENKEELYKAFMRRINTILFFDNKGSHNWLA